MKVHEKLQQLCGVLQAEGTKVTYENLRNRHGGGSRRDISAAIIAWKKRERDRAIADALELPVELQNVLEELGPKIWEITTRKYADAIRVMKIEAVIIEDHFDMEIAYLHDIIGNNIEQIEDLKARLARHEQT